MFESSTPCVFIPPSPFTFVENIQCFELVLEQKWEQGFLFFFSSVILWFSGVIILPSPSETALSETWCFRTLIQPVVPTRESWGGDSALLQKWGSKSQCVVHGSSGESMQTETGASSAGHMGPQGTHQTIFLFSYVLLIYGLCKSLPTGKHILYTGDQVFHCLPVHWSSMLKVIAFLCYQ